MRIFCAKGSHEFWPDDISLLDETRCRPRKIASAAQITDAYLLALAVARKGTLVTFDRVISLETVPGSTKANLKILGTD